MRPINMIVVHCSDSGPSTTVEDIDSWHKARGWKKIGYHQVIYPDGSVHRGREDEEIGAHCLGDNLFSLGICLIGGHDGKADFTTIQLDKLHELLVDLTQKYSIPLTEIYGHRDRPSGKSEGKLCPAFDVKAWLAQR